MQRFIDNGDNTVTDSKTGLTWTKNTIAKGVNHEAGQKAAAALGEGWRLPTSQELFSLVDHSRKEPAIDTEAFPDTARDWYWTDTPTAWNSSAAWKSSAVWNSSAVWVVCFDLGYVGNGRRGYGACVRAVRSGQ